MQLFLHKKNAHGRYRTRLKKQNLTDFEDLDLIALQPFRQDDLIALDGEVEFFPFAAGGEDRHGGGSFCAGDPDLFDGVKVDIGEEEEIALVAAAAVEHHHILIIGHIEGELFAFDGFKDPDEPIFSGGVVVDPFDIVVV